MYLRLGSSGRISCFPLRADVYSAVGEPGGVD